jgi:hypothetical protein
VEARARALGRGLRRRERGGRLLGARRGRRLARGRGRLGARPPRAHDRRRRALLAVQEDLAKLAAAGALERVVDAEDAGAADREAAEELARGPGAGLVGGGAVAAALRRRAGRGGAG